MRLRPSILLLALLPVAACATPMQLPPDFVELGGTSDFQAVTGDDARLWLRELSDPSEATLEFWANALEHDFTNQRGYQLVEKGEVKTDEGATGRWLQWNTNVGGERIGYLVAIWVTPAWSWLGLRDPQGITVVEFAARAEVFAARVEAVRAALKTVRS
jgi:hypothetical protein